MRVFIVLAAFVAVASASGYGSEQVGYGEATVPTGHSSQYRSEDNYGNYRFGYDESSGYGGSSRYEEGNGAVQRGSYSLSNADGRRRTVNYMADVTGFHADIQTNEPGVESKDSADASINKSGYNTVATPNYAPESPVEEYSLEGDMVENYDQPQSYDAPAYFGRSHESASPMEYNSNSNEGAY